MRQGLVDQLVRIYGIVPGSEPKSLPEFLATIRNPAFPYAVSSVERNMFRSGTLASALKAGLDPDDPAIQAAIQASLMATAYTNWSGD